MERRHWGLLRDQFCEHAVAAKPFLVNDAFHRAYRDLLAAARAVRGCLLLTGDPGLGKTTLLRYLLRALPFAGIIVETFPPEPVPAPASISRPGPSQRATAAARGQAQSDEDAKIAWTAFRARLVERARAGRPIVLAVDDADALSDPILLNMLAMGSAADNVGVPLNVLMTVTPSFTPRVRDLARVSGCEIVQADLAALSEADVAAYVTQALARAGARGASPFPAETIGQLSARSDGILAKINLLCGRALTFAEEAGSDVVTPEMIDRAAEEEGLTGTETDDDRRSARPSDENREKDGQSIELASASAFFERVVPTAAAPAYPDRNGARPGTGPVEAQALASRRLQPLSLAADFPRGHWAWAPLIAPGKGLAVDAPRESRSRPVHTQRFSRATMGATAAVFMAIGGMALGWHLLRAQPGSPVAAGPATDGAAAPAATATRAIAGAAEPTAASETARFVEAVRPAPGKVDVAGPAASAPDVRRPDPRPAQTELPLLPSASSSSASPPPGTATDAEIALLLARGDELLAASDAVSARLFYGRAAAQGSVAAMTAMAGTYDPLVLSSREVRGVRPDAHEAISWYRRATAAGDTAADGRRRALVDSLRRSGEVTPAEESTLLRAAE